MKATFNQFLRMCVGASVALTLTACSDSDDSGELIEGVFLDSAVEGLQYTTGTTSGITDDEGTFLYSEGDTVTFSIGNIQLGTVTGDAIVSPYSFATTNSTDIAINIARFLQTLDLDGDPSNGIEISENVRLEAENYTISFDIASAAFAENSEVTAALAQLASHLEYNYERMVSIDNAVAHLDTTLTSIDDEANSDDTDTGDDTSSDDDTDTGDDSGSDDDTDTGDDSGSDDDTDTGDDSGSDDDTDTGDDTGSDDDTDTGDDTGSDDDTDTGGDSGSDTGSSTSLSVTSNDGALSDFWDYLEVRDIAVGYVEFTGVETSILLVGGEDIDSVETLSNLTASPNNGFALVAAFADGTNITGASIISVVDGVEYNFECTVNCEITIDIEAQLITFANSEFIWEDGNDSILVSGSVEWLSSDEYVDTSDWVGSEAPTESTFCATNLATSTAAQLDGGLSYTTDDGNCVGLLSVDNSKFTKPLTATIVTTGDGAGDGSLSIDSNVKVYARTVDKGVAYVGENDEAYFETIIEGAFAITNTSDYELCLEDTDNWQMMKADGTELTKSVTVAYSFNDTEYSYDFTSFNRVNFPGLDCLPPGGSTMIHLTLSQYAVTASEDLSFPEVTGITLALEAEYNIVADDTTYTALTPDYMEWLYVNGSPGIRFAFTNNTGVQLVQDDTHPVWYYDDDGYPILRSYVYLHTQLGVEDYELIESDYIINDGDQVLLLDDSAEIAILALGGGTAVRAVLYPDL
ncbi:hypothetical protein Q4574_15345 [Aliiglaciecola sp. 3_MG-2023]|uniref:hypothetical protein n=1 Tax=Aliiglaciecola sp. 3_MG-2023 TaxID=3062644 RepID=UPI0026E3A948|nr:hypothetical protein [Aliiglaciecola sp. 3_MG-2023]MDO6694671.1 hypothetical protein [Aliiglaciecola sp. 3_MG-2023]